MIIFETDRLIVRQWLGKDKPDFYQMSADTDVMKFFPNTLSKNECNTVIQRITSLNEKNGFCFWACEVKQSKKFIGFAGLNKIDSELPFAPCVEIGWRLAKDHWGQGYATEAAKGCLEYGFQTLALKEIVSFAVKTNVNSIKVMERIGMINTKNNFMHPNVDLEHLKEHVLYKISP
jgi:ribosomal-protein-alanine N-acetyltransferase